MAVNKDAMKKHHFWILAGLVPLLVLIAVIMISSGVGAAIDEKKAAIDNAKKEIGSKSNPKPNDLLEKMGKQVVVLGEKKTSLWQENWERQIGFRPDPQDPKQKKQDPNLNLFRWPNSPILDVFNYTAEYATNKAQLKFGDPIPDPQSQIGNLFKTREVYLAEFINPNNALRPGMVDRVAPTEFNGGWERILRHVATPQGWGDRRPTSDQLWLAMEDVWVQRAMLEAVRTVNDQIGAFTRVPRLDDKGTQLPDAPLERDFQSRNWRVSLKVTTRESDNKFVLTGSLTNLTDRLQLLGQGNNMVLKVWLTPDANTPPVEFRIGGEFVPGKAKVNIVTTDDHVLQPGVNPVEITRVEQVFDTRTVPVRRIDRVVLGYPDSRNANVPLKAPLFVKEVAPAAGDGAGTPPGMGGSGGSSAGPPPGSAGVGAGGGVGGNTPAGPAIREGQGTVETSLDAAKKRYLDVTPQVRRMPVAIVLVVDQAYLQDVLLAYANSPLRFQIAQVHWQRFRGTLGGGGGGGSGPGGESDIGGPARGTGGEGFFPGAAGGGSSLGPPPGGGSSLGPPPGGGSSMGPPVGGSAGGMPGGMPPGMPPGGLFGGGGTLTTVTETQLTSGLVELSIYGTITLYEKYQPEAAPAAGN